MHTAHAPQVLIFHSYANFCVFFTRFIKGILLFCALLGIFANFARFWAFFAHILYANLSDSKFSVCYFVTVFHLWGESPLVTLSLILCFFLRCGFSRKERMQTSQRSFCLIYIWFNFTLYGCVWLFSGT